MFQKLTVDEPLERGVKHLAQADQGVDAQQAKEPALEPGNISGRHVGAPLELVLAPAGSLPQRLHPLPDAAGDFPVRLPQAAIGEYGVLVSLLRSHCLQRRHCETAVQDGAGVQP